ELTDSPHVVAGLRILTQIGKLALRQLDSSPDLVRGIHSLGDLSPERRYVVHFPSTRTIWSLGSGHGSNALLSRECHALRIASAQARQEGWLAEHMVVLGVTSPEGRKHYLAAALPEGCGRTTLSTLVPDLPGWKVETISDHAAWLHVGEDG